MRTLLSLAVATILGALFLFILLEWVAGCGEPVYSADGSWRTGDCLFLSPAPATGWG